MRSRLGGLVIAGGRSRRFGAEKAAAMFAGSALLDWSLATLTETCEAVAVSAPAGSAAAAIARAGGHDVLTDDPAHPRGPLAGLAAGLAWAAGRRFAWLATLPCDAPLLGVAQIAALSLPPDGAGAVFAVTDLGPQPLFAVWRVAVLGRLAERLGACSVGDRHPPVKAFLAEIDAMPVFFADARPFEDADTPERLARLEAQRGAGRPPTQ